MRAPRLGPFGCVLSRPLTVLACGVLALASSAAGQNFTQPKVIPTGSWPIFVGTADLNGDGYPDLIYVDGLDSSGRSTYHWMSGDGHGNFSPRPQGDAAWRGGGVAVGNFFGLSNLQIATGFVADSATGVPVTACPVAQIGFQVDVLLPTGDPNSRYSTGFCSIGSQKPVIGNVTSAVLHDGHAPSLLLTDSANRLLYVVDVSGLQGAGNPFTVTSVPLPHSASEIVVADLNNDGHLDIVVNGQISSGLSDAVADVFLGDGTGKLTFRGTYNGLSSIGAYNQTYSMLVKDVTNDGVPDLIVEGMAGRIDVFAGKGDGSFQTMSVGGTGTLNGYSGNGGHLITIADLNHDGQLDALAVTGSGVSVLLGQGTQYFGLKGIYNAGDTGGSGTPSYALADFNQDGNLDLAVDSPEGIAILFGTSDGSFETSLSFASSTSVLSLPLGSFSSTSNVDAVASGGNSAYEFLRGNGDGAFAQLGYGGGSAGNAGTVGNALAGDFNGDGKLDLFVTADAIPIVLPNGGNGQFFFSGNGDGTFGASQQPPSPMNTCQPMHPLFGTSAVADFNGDGFSDVVNRDLSATRIYLGAAKGTPALAETIPDGNCNQIHNLVAAGRLTGGKLPDLLVQRGGSLLLYPNDGTGKFPQQAMGDLAVDGSLTTPGQMTAPALGATFGATSPTLGFAAFPGTMVIADLDRDGNQDIIVSYANLGANLTAPVASSPNYLYIWYGSGSGKFLTSAKHPLNPVRLTPSRNFYQVAVADMNGDGIPDLILSDGHILSVQLGMGDGTFGAETHSLAGQGLNQISVADVNNDGKLDLVVANGGAVLGNPVAPMYQYFVQPLIFSGGITVLLNHAAAVLPKPMGTLTASPEPTTYGSPFTLTANFNNLPVVSSPYVTGTITFSVDSTVVGSATVAGGITTMAVPASIYSTLAVGTHTLTGVYSGDSAYAATTLAGTHTVTQIPTSLSLALCVDPPGSNYPCGPNLLTDPPPIISPITLYYGQVLDGVVLESETDLTGTISIYSGSYVFCVLNANLQQGSNSCPPSLGYLGVGTTTDYALYSGDAAHQGSTSNKVVVTVLADSTTATVSSSANPSTYGQLVTFTATVQGDYAPATGTVQLLDGTTVIGTATLDPTGTASFPISTLAIGTHPITVVYGATPDFNGAISGVLSQVVNPVQQPVASAVTLTSSINPSAPGQPVTFTATVTVPGSFAIVPTGSVTFLDGTNALSTVTLNALGIAMFTTSSLASGSHAMTASYGGAPAIGGSGPVQPPNPPKPPNPFAHGISLGGSGARPALRAIMPSVPAPVPAPLKAAAVPQATAATPQILPSVSAELVQVVTYPLNQQPSGFALTVSPVPVTLGVGEQAVLLVTVNEYSGFSAPVRLSCSGLPYEATCTFVQPTIGAGGGSTTLYLAVTAPHACGSNTPLFVGSMVWPRLGGVALALLVLLPGIRRRKGLRARLLVVGGLCGLAAISGCGNCTDLGTRPGNYTVTVSGTGGTTTQSQAVKLTVTIP